MIFNKIQLLRNRPIKIERDTEGEFLYVQGPTIGELYDSEKLFMATQMILMTDEELRNFIGLKDKKFTKDEIINLIIDESESGSALLQEFQRILPGIYFEEHYLMHGDKAITSTEWEKVKNLLEIIMGQKNYKDFSESEKELSPEEKRLKELEARVQAKKEKQAQKEVKTEEDDKHILEDIMIALTYEFGFDIEQMMDMNYFTLIWYYSYTSKIHVYRLNQFAVSSGMVKKINTDYFTNIK